MTDNTGKLLPESELLYQNLFQSMNEALAIGEMIFDEDGNPEDYRHLEVNPAFERIIGLPADQVKGRMRREFGPADPYWLELFGQVVKTGTPASRVDYSTGSGKWFDLRAFSLGGRKFAFLFTDITERKQSDDALRQFQQKFTEILEDIDGGFITYDKEWRFTHLNTRAAQNVGYEPSDLIGKSIWEVFPKTLGTPLEAYYRKAMTERVPVHFEEQGTLTDRWYSYDIYPTREGIVNFWHDITERKLAEKEIEAARYEAINEKNRLQAVMEALPVGVAIIDNQGGNVHSNPSFEKIWGGPRPITREVGDYAAYQAWWVDSGRLVQPEEWASARAVLQGETVIGQFIKIQRFDGTFAYILNSAAPILDAHGQITGSAVAIQDITELKQAEDALREGEEEYRELVENANTIIIKMDKSGIITFFNDYAQRFFGYSGDEVLGQDVKILLPPVESSTGRSLAEMAAAALENPDGFTEIINENIRKNGERVWILWRNKALKDSNGNTIGNLAIGLDITERRRSQESLYNKQEELTAANEELQAQQEEITAANEELRAQQEELFSTYQELQRQADVIREHAQATSRARDEAERRAAELDTVIASIIAGIVIFDTSGNIIRINEFARNLLGYSSDDYHLSYHERRERLKLLKSDGSPYKSEESPLSRALRGEAIHNEEMMIARIPDHPVWISTTFSPIYDQNSRLLGVILVFMDITAQKRKTDELLASERELLKVTLHSLTEGVVAADWEGRIMFMNETAAQLIGYAPDQVIGEPVNQILYVVDDKTSEPIIPTTAPKVFYNSILVTRDQREIPISMNSLPIKDREGRIMGTVTVFADITEKQKTELELLKTEKLESLGILAGGIAHDFNNILAAILSNIQLAIRKLEKGADIKLYLSNTVETTRKASELTKQLLTFSRGGAPVKKDASLIDLIKDTADFALRGSNIKAEFAIPEDLWVASVDEGQISQVLHNLVINGKQAMPKGGIIYISAENTVIPADEHVRFHPGAYVKIMVKDQGVGIAKENLTKIFDPFFTTKKDGNGLGLATSYSIISRHNGYIDVESLEGVGTSFFIYLPASNETVIEVETEERPGALEGGTGSSLKILLMDDEEKILHAVGAMLESYGHQVALTADGAEVIERYRQFKELGVPFDVVIMDLTIPGGMGGQEAIAHLRDFDPNIIAIVSSGYANDPIMANYERFGFCGFVSKPYKFDELNEVLHRVALKKQRSLKGDPIPPKG
ncbi:MAG TPA: PAS domain S-box protein [Bacillota bacterium]|nr:PAS domain S-box protein [Bacillota bacterium]